ncbi:hypothetical protein KIN20_031458 [Parelaphostrongylus tenuis]|uniref:Uncharacterized protein n=2 Tax=Parelaphostrongylus tenuis TaxID=148309 RepID=A0AAD5R5I7_PARTN|nr:hypothetical protein KIN20_031458 [Parelaphostrongylus tenuis]
MHPFLENSEKLEKTDPTGGWKCGEYLRFSGCYLSGVFTIFSWTRHRIDANACSFQQLDRTEGVCLLTNIDRNIEMIEMMRTLVETLQVTDSEVVADDMLATTVVPQQYLTTVVPQEVVKTYILQQQYIRSTSNHIGQVVPPGQIETSVASTNRVCHIVQNSPLTVK